jgi:serine protease Do
VTKHRAVLEEVVSRIARSIVLLAAPLVLLSGCALGGPGSAPGVGFEDVQTATIQLQAQGTFVEPGTVEASETAGRGSGFFIDPSGIAVTNNHVVVGAGTLKIWVGGDQSKQYNAKVLGASECLDLAVVQLDPGTYPFFNWYQGEIKTALDVYSAGFPLGDPNFTMTRGIVSKADVPQEDSWASLDHVIEHDARIRGGNSGGPLVAPDGKVVGVNYAGNDELDYNYAIHRDQVLPYLEQLKKGERVLSLGINAQAMAPGDDGSATGIWISSVEAGGPADAAGIQPGDLLIDLAGVTMGQNGTLEDYCQVLQTQGVDGTMEATIYRPGTDELWAGQINGDPLELAGSNVGGGGSDEPIGSFVDITDDAGVIAVRVPDTWSDVQSESFVDDTGATWYTLKASPDIAGYESDLSVPGVTLNASADAAAAPDALLDTVTEGIDTVCVPNEEDAPYDDGYYVGVYSYYTDCGGTTTAYVVLAVQDVGGSHVMIVSIQAVSELDKTTVLEQILGSFQAAP